MTPDNYCDFLFRGHQIFRLKIFNAIMKCPYLIIFTGALIKFNLFTRVCLKQTIYYIYIYIYAHETEIATVKYSKP